MGKIKKVKQTKLERLLQDCHSGAMAQDAGRSLLNNEGHVQPIVLNDFLVHLLQQIQIMQQTLEEHGIVPKAAALGKTPGGIILPRH